MNIGRTIILEDFNARVGNLVILGIKQKLNEEELNENGELLIDFCTENEFRIMMHFLIIKYNTKSTLDYILVLEKSTLCKYWKL